MYIYPTTECLVCAIYTACSVEQKTKFVAFIDKYPSFVAFLNTQCAVSEAQLAVALAAEELAQGDADLIQSYINAAQGK
jgi:hypothetical protein